MATFPSRGFRRTRDRASGLLFAFGVDDWSTVLASGQTLSFDRNSSRHVLDSAGRVVTLAYDQMPWSAAYDSASGIYEPVYSSMADSANYVLRSEDFGTTWGVIGTPTRTAAAKTCGMVALDLLGDDAAGTLEGYSQAITPSGGNGVKGVSCFVAPGTSTSSVIRVRDTTAGADRLLQRIQWTAGVPNVTATTGTYLGAVRCADGVYRLLFQTTSWTTSNANQVEVYPATSAALAVANTGTLYVGGVCAEKHIYPRGYVKTVGSTVVESADTLTSSVGWSPQDCTVYVRCARPEWAQLAVPSGVSTNDLVSIGGPGGTFAVYVNTGTTVVGEVSDGTTPRTASATLPLEVAFDVCVQIQAMSTGATVRVDVGSGFGSASAATGIFAAWGTSTLRIGLSSDLGIRRVLIAAGARTLADMRGLAV